ncbi:MAG: hypothetical protein JW808_07030, partial [Victivallales bacterium]|nr:hypothetical protein [Victivallales bacterium]
MMRKLFGYLMFSIAFCGLARVFAEELVASGAPVSTVSAEMFAVNNTWMLVAIFLVFVMHLGFATLEVGLTRAKNTVNILFKNTVIVAIGFLTYAFIGFNMMYPGDAWVLGKVLGFGGLGIDAPAGAAGLINYA